MKNFNLEHMGLLPLNEMELVEIGGGKSFLRTIADKVVNMFYSIIAQHVAEELADEVLN
jgi:hypothetical protein